MSDELSIADTPRICPRCGGEFACGVDRPRSAPCWCTAVALTTVDRTTLAETYAGCLCPSCLIAAAVRQ